MADRYPEPMSADHDAEMDVIVAQLERAGLVERYTQDDGKLALRLTASGAQLGRALALAGDDGGVVLDALLEGDSPPMSA